MKLSVFPDLVKGVVPIDLLEYLENRNDIPKTTIDGVIARCNSFITGRINNFYNLSINAEKYITEIQNVTTSPRLNLKKLSFLYSYHQ